MNKLIVSLIFIFSSNFFSHEFNPAHLLINETEELEYEALWMTPIKNLGTSPELSFPKICEIEYLDINGKIKVKEFDGLMSTCVQHEINHLDGKLIIDHLSKLKRDLIIKRIYKKTNIH